VRLNGALVQEDERCWNRRPGDPLAAREILRRGGWDATPGGSGIVGRIGLILNRRMQPEQE
jgi:hypothetical protein